MNIVGENRWWQRLLYFYIPLGIFVALLLVGLTFLGRDRHKQGATS